MAHTWYYAVCEKCGEGTKFFVSNPSCTAAYLKQRDWHIQAFLQRHFNCDLRMVNTDTDIDWLWESGFRHSEGDKDLIIRPKGYVPAKDGKPAHCDTCKDWVATHCDCRYPLREGTRCFCFVDCLQWDECPDCGRKNGNLYPLKKHADHVDNLYKLWGEGKITSASLKYYLMPENVFKFLMPKIDESDKNEKQ